MFFYFLSLKSEGKKGRSAENKQKYQFTQETKTTVKMKLWNAKITQTGKQVADVHIVPSVFNWKIQGNYEWFKKIYGDSHTKTGKRRAVWDSPRLPKYTKCDFAILASQAKRYYKIG